MELEIKEILHKRYNFNKEKNFFYKNNDDIIAYDYLINKYSITNIEDKSILYHILYLDYSKYSNKIGKFNIVTSLYNEKRISRSLELLLCLSINLKNNYISKIFILQEFYPNKHINENMSLISEVIFLLNKISNINLHIEYIYERPSFQFLFNFCNKNIIGPVIITNSDIIYDSTLSKITNLNNDHFLAISRNNKSIVDNKIKWDTIKFVHNSQFLDNIFSHDTWIFNSPQKFPIKIDISLGEMFCDSYLNYKLSKSLYKCYNLSRDINCFHIQEGDSTSDIISRDQELCNKKLNIIYEKENGDTNILMGLKIISINDFYNNINYNQFIIHGDYIKEYS